MLVQHQGLNLSTYHCWASSCTLDIMLKRKKRNLRRKNNGESHLRDVEQVTSKPELIVNYCVTSWLHSCNEEIASEKNSAGVHPEVPGKTNFVQNEPTVNLLTAHAFQNIFVKTIFHSAYQTMSNFRFSKSLSNFPF